MHIKAFFKEVIACKTIVCTSPTHNTSSILPSGCLSIYCVTDELRITLHRRWPPTAFSGIFSRRFYFLHSRNDQFWPAAKCRCSKHIPIHNACVYGRQSWEKSGWDNYSNKRVFEWQIISVTFLQRLEYEHNQIIFKHDQSCKISLE